MSKNSEPKTVEIKGRLLKCPVCENKLFHTRRALLNTPRATFFNFDWANKTATCYVCTNCTHISWFLEK